MLTALPQGINEGVLQLQGMGEGEGRKDVSDQIQDEDQLLGAQQKDQPPPESKVQPAPSQAPQQPWKPAPTSIPVLLPSHVHSATLHWSPASSCSIWKTCRGAFQFCNSGYEPARHRKE